jgi:prepilin peptidase CpaA
VTAQVWIAIVIGLVATVEDIARRRISNWIPISAFAAGTILQLVDRGWRGGVSALLGAVAGFCVFLIFYILGGMGGGDIKLMAGFGAILGPMRVLEASLWVAGCGGLLAVAVIAWSTVRAFWRKRLTAGASKEQSPESIPYAPAIAAGVWLSLVPKG